MRRKGIQEVSEEDHRRVWNPCDVGMQLISLTYFFQKFYSLIEWKSNDCVSHLDLFANRCKNSIRIYSFGGMLVFYTCNKIVAA